MVAQEPVPEPTQAEIAREAEQEAAVFAQAANIDRLAPGSVRLPPICHDLTSDSS